LRNEAIRPKLPVSFNDQPSTARKPVMSDQSSAQPNAPLSAQLNAIVTQRIEVAPGLIILRVSPDGWPLPDFESGQFAVLGLPEKAARVPLADPEDSAETPDRLIRRAYSIASSSLDKSYLEFYVTLVHSGRLTPRLFALQAGDRVHLGKKFSGTFTLDQVPAGSDLVLVATGTGLAPYMSMLRSEIVCHPEACTTVVLGARHTWDLGYRGELTAMQRFCRTFHYIPVISRPDEELTRWNGHTGYVQDVWERGLIGQIWGRQPDASRCHVLLCGGPRMIESMLTVLTAAGFREQTKDSPGQIHVEKYW
jgi:ferredoxin--NADP+ reductase